ncbi:hypothetical protein E2562_008507 [Oryza meyeriana var. granulata]|uniref:Uncharacterized protein n=1 Tax=Oryza meyeriana var. granulata TaxID=110450 RepID=A0A6G1EHB6_9ORYZ|nr:hypothetical protein E2562_008507 [Oryza meyeriana var. granulata]
MLSALHAAALLDMDAAANLEVLCRFFTLHRDTGTSSSRVTAEGGLLLSPSSNTQNKDKEEETSSPNKKKMKKNAASSPTTRLPLTDVRKNLEQMISSLLGHGHGAKLALAGEMRGLLAKVDKMLAAGPAAATTPTAHGSPLN